MKQDTGLPGDPSPFPIRFHELAAYMQPLCARAGVPVPTYNQLKRYAYDAKFPSRRIGGGRYLDAHAWPDLLRAFNIIPGAE